MDRRRPSSIPKVRTACKEIHPEGPPETGLGTKDAAGPSRWQTCAAFDARAAEAAVELSRHVAAWATVADVAALGGAGGAVSAQGVQQQKDWLSPISDSLQSVLDSIQAGLEQYHIPYSYGWSIIALTVLTKIVMFPFTKAQVSVLLNMNSLVISYSS